ncbi:MAG: hypothetical protein HGA29_01185 [Syntrophaceae bacterium]|nr:hypothetical protein [Syntrophaceae bacterium]
MPQARRENHEERSVLIVRRIACPVLDTGNDEAQRSIRPFYEAVFFD